MTQAERTVSVAVWSIAVVRRSSVDRIAPSRGSRSRDSRAVYRDLGRFRQAVSP